MEALAVIGGIAAYLVTVVFTPRLALTVAVALLLELNDIQVFSGKGVETGFTFLTIFFVFALIGVFAWDGIDIIGKVRVKKVSSDTSASEETEASDITTPSILAGCD